PLLAKLPQLDNEPATGTTPFGFRISRNLRGAAGRDPRPPGRDQGVPLEFSKAFKGRRHQVAFTQVAPLGSPYPVESNGRPIRALGPPLRPGPAGAGRIAQVRLRDRGQAPPVSLASPPGRQVRVRRASNRPPGAGPLPAVQRAGDLRRAP